MKAPTHKKIAALSVLLALPTLGVSLASAQAGDPPPLRLSAAADHQAMMDKLHITTPLRPAAAGGQNAVNDPNYANYDEAKAKSKSPVPDLLTMANGQKITTAAQWMEHRKELYELFDREIYGRVPEAAKTVKVTWTVTSTTEGMSGTTPTITRQLNGHVDNSFYPQIEVNIGASVTTPANAKGPVPVVIVFGGGGGGGAPRGAAGGGAGLPALAAMKTQLTLSDAEIAQITPILAGYTAMQATVNKATADRDAARTKATTDITAMLTTAQKRAFTAFVNGTPAVLVGQALPTLAALQQNQNLALTPDQVAAITPILAAFAQAQSDLTDASEDNTAFRTKAIAQISQVMNKPQQGQFATLTAPRGRGAAGGGGGGGVQEALAHGWGYGSINPASIQADNGGGLTSGGVVALFAKGQERNPDDWGALRAWAWGADRLLDFFATDKLVDGKQVAFEGHSRYGKATIVTLVYDERAATGFVSSSGEGGAKIWRHMVGETVMNLGGGEEYHWMAGNFIKYAGPLTVDDLPIDQNEFVALVAPRPIFISGGEYVPMNGIGGARWSGESWQDTPGTFLATIGASPAWVLLGKKGLSNDALNLHLSPTPDLFDSLKEMPPPLTPLIDGDIAFRQHDQGHTDAPNWGTFYEFAAKHMHAPQ